jgi:hypothetical protein
VSLTGVGLATSLYGDSSVGGAVTIVGLVVSIVALHRLGRSGSAPIRHEESPHPP